MIYHHLISPAPRNPIYSIPPPSYLLFHKSRTITMQAASNTTQTVLITGLNSYVSAQVALEFLRRGTWRVLATARSQEKYNSIVESEAFAPYSDRIEFHLCTDLTTHDWTDALKGMIRTWIPFHNGLLAATLFSPDKR